MYMEDQQQTAQRSFEQVFGQSLFKSQNVEKAYTDKLLSRKEVSEVQELIKKEDLTRSELLELLYLLSSSEIKLANFNDFDRYLLGKFLSWIRDFVSCAEIIYDYENTYRGLIEENEEAKKDVTVMKEILNLMENNRKFILHNIKFLVDIFLYLSRSTLSLSMSAFDSLSKSRFEYAYPGYEGLAPREEQARRPILSWRR